MGACAASLTSSVFACAGAAPAGGPVVAADCGAAVSVVAVVEEAGAVSSFLSRDHLGALAHSGSCLFVFELRRGVSLVGV